MQHYKLSLLLVSFCTTVQATIHVIGDSHSRMFASIADAKVHWIGACTMHRIGRDGLSFLNVKNYGIQEGDAIIFVFGEIDVRCHIGKQRDLQKKSEDEIIGDLVRRYLATIQANRAQYKQLTCAICLIIPPTDTIFNPEYPYYGSLSERVAITNKLNQFLYKACQRAHIFCIDAYAPYQDADGSLKQLYGDGNVHIRADCSEPLRAQLHALGIVR